MRPLGWGLLGVQLAIATALAALSLAERHRFVRVERELRAAPADPAPATVNPGPEEAAAGDADDDAAPANDRSEEGESGLTTEEDAVSVRDWRSVSSLPPEEQRTYAEMIFQAFLDGQMGPGDVAFKLEDLDPAVTLETVRTCLPEINDPEQRAALMENLAIHAVDYAMLLSLLDLGMSDAHPSVRVSALDALFGNCFVDLADDPEAYMAWRERTRNATGEEIARLGAAELVRRLENLGPGSERTAELLERLNALRHYSPPNALVDGGLTLLVERWLASGPSGAEQAVALLRFAEPEPEWVRTHILPLLSDPSTVPAAARALAAHATPGEAIPLLLRALRDAPSPEGRASIMRAGLCPITGIRASPDHSVDWWEEWWRHNAAHYGAAPEPR